ncbi:prostatic acid phosphatase-like isoform X2 [Numida meleagris]|uniref:prostatic acid phosphatase-like isoform X2 n=1 Tax=Numida meleagris TaxID=8996 RepID=UPI000B3D8EF5|nr:prostatic acid phosphatase-like isoform X2 [Numida meleagris]
MEHLVLYFHLLCKCLLQELEGSEIPCPVIHRMQKLSASAKYNFHFMNLQNNTDPRREKREEEWRSVSDSIKHNQLLPSQPHICCIATSSQGPSLVCKTAESYLPLRMRSRQLVCGIWSLCFTFCLFCIFLHQTTAKRKLKFVSVVFHHGDHTPQEFFPTDKHKEIARQHGYGQLTKFGIQQQYELGQYMRRRYSYFLSVVYKQTEIYAQSTDCDQTLMSAQATLAGLYPPTQGHIWNPRILWQPIPVHTVPLSHDNLLYVPFSHCPKYNELLRETFATRDFQKQLKQYRSFLKFLASHTGYPLKKLNSERILRISDTLQYEDINNYTLPAWASHGVRTKLIKLSELLLKAEFGFHKQIQKSRLQGGLLLKTILKHMSDARKPSHHQKMIIYSAHRATIVALQMALDVFNGKLPPYSACHFFELYQEKNGQYTIEMYYRNNTLRDPHPLTLPGCSFRCPLERFTHLVSPVLARHWTRECRI